MGFHRHHSTIVTSWSERYIRGAHEFAASILTDRISEISRPANNGYRSFTVYTDGSKEGWPAAKVGEANLARLSTWLNESGFYGEWVQVSYDECGEKEVEHYRNSDLLVALDAIAEGNDPLGKHRKALEIRLGLRNVEVS